MITSTHVPGGRPPAGRPIVHHRRRPRRLVAALVGLAACALSACQPSTFTAVLTAGRSGTPARTALWSQRSTWGGAVPGAGADVVVPEGATVVIDRNIDVGSIDVRGTLVCANKDLRISARWILVDGGRLSCGTAAAPFTKRLMITLTGGPGTEDVMGMGTKFLGAIGGVLELHGATPGASWTSLAADAAAGARSITVTAPPGWKAGDRIVIATGSVDQRAVDVVTVASVRGATVKLTAPLRHDHLGRVVQAGDVSVELRSSVGLLTHNIVVTGDASSAATGFGAHMMFMATAQPTTVQLQGVEVTAAGQHDRVGRYPVHFHQMRANCVQCYVRSSSIHDTIQRGIVLHDSSGITISDAVVFNTVGHNVVIETPETSGNVLDHNLALVNRQPIPAFTAEGLRDQRDDHTSAYWFRSARNTVTRNVSAGSTSAGFLFDDVDVSGGTNGTSGTSVGTAEFHGNTVYGTSGFDDTEDFFVGSGLVARMCRASMPAQPDFTDTLAYDNANSGYWPEDCSGGDHTKQWLSGLTSLGNPAAVGEVTSGDVLVTDSTFFLGDHAGLPYANDGVHHQYGGNTELRGITVVGDPSALLSETDVALPYRSRFTVSGVRVIDGGSEPYVPHHATDYRDDSLVPRGFYVVGGLPELTTSACTPGSTARGDDVFNWFRCPNRYEYGIIDIRPADPQAGDDGPYLDGPRLASDVSMVRDDGVVTGQYGSRTDLDDAYQDEFYAILGTGASYTLPSLPASGWVIARLDRDDAVFETPTQVEQWSTRITIPLERAPQAVIRSTYLGQDNSVSWEAGPDVPVGAPTLRRVGTLAELAADPFGTYVFDDATRRLTVVAGHRWLIVQR